MSTPAVASLTGLRRGSALGLLLAVLIAMLASCGSSSEQTIDNSEAQPAPRETVAQIPTLDAEAPDPVADEADAPEASNMSITAWPSSPPDPITDQSRALATIRWAIENTAERPRSGYRHEVRTSGIDGPAEIVQAWTGAFDDTTFSGSAAYSSNEFEPVEARVVAGIEWAVTEIDGADLWIGGVIAVSPAVAANAYEFASVDAFLGELADAIDLVDSIDVLADGESRWSVGVPGDFGAKLFRGALDDLADDTGDATAASLGIEIGVDRDGHIVELSADAGPWLAATGGFAADVVATMSVEIGEPLPQTVEVEAPCGEPVLRELAGYGPALICLEEVLAGEAEDAPAQPPDRGTREPGGD